MIYRLSLLLYAIIIGAIIVGGFLLWQDKVQLDDQKIVNDFKAQAQNDPAVKKQKELENFELKPKEANTAYKKAIKDDKEFNITFVTNNKLQNEDGSKLVSEQLEQQFNERIKIHEVMLEGDSSQLNDEEVRSTIYEEDMDMLLIDSFLLNDYLQGVSTDNHRLNIGRLYVDAYNNQEVPVYIVGQRLAADNVYNEILASEEDFFESNDYEYIDQYSEWESLTNYDEYVNGDGTLTEKGTEFWANNIYDYFVKD